LFEWSYEKAGLEFKKMDHLRWLKKRSRPLIYKKADELFITNVIKGIQPIKIQKKEFNVVLAKVLLEKLNEVVVLFNLNRFSGAFDQIM
jgi:branched-chain amino acid aminotransferase